MGVLVLFLYLKEKEQAVNASVDRQKKQTNLRFDRLCGFDGTSHAYFHDFRYKYRKSECA